MAQDNEERPNRVERLREAIESKLKPKTERRETPGPARGPAPAETARPSAVETARHIMRSEIAIRGPRLQDLAYMCRQLATLIDVGIPLLRSLRIMSERTRHPRLRQVMTEAADDVERGTTLSAALAKHPKSIPPLISNIIRIGETGGILENALRRLAEIYERKADINRKVIAAMAYPAVALTVAIAVLIVIFTYAIPVFEAVYTQKQGVELPRITLQVIAVSEFVRHWWGLYIPVLLIAAILLYSFGRTVAGRRMYDGLRLHVPVFGPLNVKIGVARFTRTLSNLLSAGIPLIEALSATAQSTENVIVAETLMQTRENIEQGGKLEETLRVSSAIPPIVTDMIAIGDEAGALDTMLVRMADVYESEIDAGIKGLVALIEPLLIIFLGLVVITIALAVLLPYWHIGSVID